MTGGGSATTGGGSAVDAGRDSGIPDAGRDAGAPDASIPDGGSIDSGISCFVPRCLSPGPNLLANGNFDTVPTDGSGDGQQGMLPPPWAPVIPTPDTYNTDGGFGLINIGWSNFPDDMHAHSGDFWVAGWSLYNESPGQELTVPLIAGHHYRIAAWLHQASRVDVDHPGAYSVNLASDPQTPDLNEMGRWCETESVDAGWVERAFIFTAPVDAGSWLILKPYTTSTGSAYPGLDDVVLEDMGSCNVVVE